MPLIRAVARRRARALLLALSVLSVAPLSACRPMSLDLVIVDFESAQIEGLRIWKLDYTRGTYVEAMRLEFMEIVDEDGGETLLYRIWKDGRPVVRSTAVVVEHLLGDEDIVRLRPIIPGLGQGAYRLSSYNAAGESALSAGWVTV